VHQTKIYYEETDFGQIQGSMGNDMEEMIGTFGFVSIHEEKQSSSKSQKTFPPQRSVEFTFSKRPISMGKTFRQV